MVCDFIRNFAAGIRTLSIKEYTLKTERYAEVIGNTAKAKDILTGRYYDLSKNLELKPRQSLIIEY